MSVEARRLQLTLDMYELGEQMMRSRLRREAPEATADEIEERISAWLMSKPVPEFRGSKLVMKPWLQ